MLSQANNLTGLFSHYNLVVNYNKDKTGEKEPIKDIIKPVQSESWKMSRFTR